MASRSPYGLDGLFRLHLEFGCDIEGISAIDEYLEDRPIFVRERFHEAPGDACIICDLLHGRSSGGDLPDGIVIVGGDFEGVFRLVRAAQGVSEYLSRMPVLSALLIKGEKNVGQDVIVILVI